MMKKVLMLVALLAVTGIASAEILSDPGFESGNLASWTNRFGGAYSASYSWGWYYNNQSVVTDAAAAHSGSNYLKAGNYHWAASWGYSQVGQTMSATAGTEYGLSAFFMDDAALPGSAGTITALLKLVFADGPNLSGTKTATEIPLVLSSDLDLGWQLHSMSAIAPFGTVSMRALIGMGNPNQDMRIDDASLTVVPEPVTVALLGLGGLFLRRRK